MSMSKDQVQTFNLFFSMVLVLQKIMHMYVPLFLQYWNRTAQLRPTTGPARKDGSKAGGSQKYNSLLKNSGKPPKGMYVNHDDLVALATGPATQGEQLLKAMDREIVSYKRTVRHFCNTFLFKHYLTTRVLFFIFYKITLFKGGRQITLQ